MALTKIAKGIFAKTNKNGVTHLTIPATGFPGAKPNTYMACGFHDDGSLNVVVVGIPLARAKKMVEAWGTPFDKTIPMSKIQESFGEDEPKKKSKLILTSTITDSPFNKSLKLIEKNAELCGLGPIQKKKYYEAFAILRSHKDGCGPAAGALVLINKYNQRAA